MKNRMLLVVISFLMATIGHSQEWFTSLDVAKRLALVQNKMLFVMWENSLNSDYPIVMNDESGRVVVINLSENQYANFKIWEHFVPVLIPESDYLKVSNKVKEIRGITYFDKLNDDSIKIMDINGNILNVNTDGLIYENISDYINLYAFDTSFLRNELESYFKDKNATTAFLLASKYLDFAIFANRKVQPEIIALANIYFDESKQQLIESNYSNKMAFLQQIELLEIKEALILNKPKKGKRLLKKQEKVTIEKINESLFAFLNYTTLKLLHDQESAELWKSKISLLDLKKAEIIIKNNRTIGNTH